MGPEEAVRLRAMLDRMVKEKEIAAAFFARMAESLEEVDQRRAFRRMAQDEKDQRKIVMKHRRELCGSVPSVLPVQVSALHDRLTKVVRGEEPGLEEALALAIRSAEEAGRFIESFQLVEGKVRGAARTKGALVLEIGDEILAGVLDA